MSSSLPSIRRNALSQYRHWLSFCNLSSPASLRSFSRFKQTPRFPSTIRTVQLSTRSPWPRFPRRPQNVRFNGSKPTPDPTPNLGSPEPQLTYSQRFRKLGREYGWSAMGIYFALSALDFPFCFLAVRLLGTERIGHWEHVAVEGFWKILEVPFPNIRESKVNAEETGPEGEAIVRESVGWGVEEAEAENRSDRASIWTQLALAYAIHKSFIFIRLPFTVAITPKVVKTLRGWGWDIGKRKAKAVGKP